MSSNVADATTAATTAGSGELLGHPKGLYICFATELWERFSFYGMKYLLLLYLTKYHLFTDSAGYDVLGAYAGLVYALPLIGGLLADRYLGMRKAVLFGGILLCLGHLLMAVEGHQAVSYAAGTVLSEAITLNDGTVIAAGTTLANDVVIQDVVALKVFFMALALITVGVGFLKPNISTIVGQLYAKNDPRRDAGFTIFYMGINIGSFVATLLCGWLGETYGWGYGFGLAGIGMLFGLITFIWGQKYLNGLAEPSRPEVLKQKALGPINKEWAVYLGGIASLALVWFLVQSEPVVHLAQNSLLIVAIVGLILYSMLYNDSKGKDMLAIGLAVLTAALGLVWAFTDVDIWLGAMLLGLVAFIVYGFRRHYSEEFSRTVVLMVLITSTIVFWALFEQSAGSMTLYADRVLDRSVGNSEIRASMFGSLNAGFIMLLAIPFATLWVWLGKRGWEPSTPVKFGLGIIQAGLGFGALVLGAAFPTEAGKVAMIWLVLAYLLHTTGELCLSPVGLSAVTKLSIGKVVSVSMGTWFLATALSETVATRIGKMAALYQDGTGDLASTLATYTNLYEYLMWWGLGVGALMILLSPLLKKGMCGIR
ncbi:peptide MFS transporter [Microbulbifer thermotolerans]|uniref:Peptide MFS transporter n=1 Tax=Microbulbifer thermotolerans TaxID=252514 RepID=A0AB35I4Q3_MICTH|nr:peptide MFS transporter [Microbulbifer thermotolerans]MCX2780904.1 peptide MFS transporter [Microbulbifer thermotolerans]MCX2783545.1 peptide MFS transporter [Microbulbifer thermotolerans]MCX2803315.1 peptide MFS transporter [Microbulbifer thermotolerans]MCX2806640.1 peptide MFS transporter [Microbulbifer thermotolerans]MCX2831526.1 peptide MFS transporter [Microbulbifer thermotolerans]